MLSCIFLLLTEASINIPVVGNALSLVSIYVSSKHTKYKITTGLRVKRTPHTNCHDAIITKVIDLL